MKDKLNNKGNKYTKFLCIHANQKQIAKPQVNVQSALKNKYILSEPNL